MRIGRMASICPLLLVGCLQTGRPSAPIVLTRIPWPREIGSDAIGPAFPSLSGDCSSLAFAVAGDVYVRRLPDGPSELVSIGRDGGRGDRPSGIPVLSGDGTHIAFDSAATNLVAGAHNRHDHVFERSLARGETVRASVNGAGEIANDANLAYHGGLALSRDGSIVAFNSHASNLVPGDGNGKIDVFVRTLSNGPTVRASVSDTGTEGNGDSISPALADDGSIVAFASDADDLVPGDRNGVRDVFLRDLRSGRTTRLSVSRNGTEANGASDAPAISLDGRLVAFSSKATNLAPADPASRRILVVDRQSGELRAVSAGLGPGERADFPALNDDGSRVAFVSRGSGADADTPGEFQAVFVLDRSSGAVHRVSAAPSGELANEESGSWGIASSADGACVAFTSLASNLVAEDRDQQSDLFLARLPGASPRH